MAQMPKIAVSRYSAFAIVLHWAIAAAILFNLPLGLWMHAQAQAGHVDAQLFRAFQLHKSIGLSVLALSVLRLGWRLAHRPPRLPERMLKWERYAAYATHWAFYVLMIALPLSGWLYVSTGWSGETNHPLVVETRYFNLFTVPFLFDLTHASEVARASGAQAALFTHWALGLTALALAAIHVGAALKHQLIDRDQVMARMAPGLGRRLDPAALGDGGRKALIGAGLAMVAAALIATFYALFSPLPARSSAASAPLATPLASDQGGGAATPGLSAVAPAPISPNVGPAAALQVHAPPAWSVDTAASAVAFTITYGAQPYAGAFDHWRADIRFDANDLEHSSAQVNFETSSAHTSDQMQTSELGAAAWLDTQRFPVASFRTVSIRHLRGDAYLAQGPLTLKGRTRTVSLPFTLVTAGDRATMNGQITLNRQDFDIGAGDASIGDTVAVKVRVVATQAP